MYIKYYKRSWGGSRGKGEERAPRIMNADGGCWPECIFSFKTVEKGGLAKPLAKSPCLVFCITWASTGVGLKKEEK